MWVFLDEFGQIGNRFVLVFIDNYLFAGRAFLRLYVWFINFVEKRRRIYLRWCFDFFGWGQYVIFGL